MRSSQIIVGASLLVLGGCSDATGPSRTPARLDQTGGNFQFGTPGQPLANQLEVRVIASDSLPLAGAVVTWSVASGTASLGTTSGTTDANGMSSTVVTLGATAGLVTVQASTPGTTILTFTMYNGDPCADQIAYTVGQMVSGQLTPVDCPYEGDSSPMDLYDFTVAAPTHLSLTMSSGVLPPFVFLWDSAGGLVGFSIDQSGGLSHTEVRALVPAGRYTIGANTLVRTAIGSYQVTSLARALDVVNCDLTWVRRGLDVAQTTHTTTCPSPTGAKNGEHMLMVIDSAQTVTFEMTAAGFGPSITVLDVNDVLLTSATAAAGATATVSYTAPRNDIIVIRFGGTVNQALPFQMRIN